MLVWALALAAPLSAQSGTTAVISGTVTEGGIRPLPRSLVTLTSLDRGGTREVTADAAGAYRFSLVAPGSYELRAEILGYRPLVARTLRISGGQSVTVNLALTPEPPPVLFVDTLQLGAAAASRFEPAGLRFGARELERVPHRDQDLSDIAALSTELDESLGFQGLPGSMALMVVDGVPVYRPSHPTALADEMGSAAFPRTSLAGVDVLPGPADMELGGSAGGYARVGTLTSVGDGLSLQGSWSGGPLWSSSQLDASTPSLLSFQGAASATVPVVPGESQIVLSGDVFREDTPMSPRISESVAGGLAGLDPTLVEELLAPTVERYARYSGLARFDAQQERSHVFARGALGYSKRDFDGPGPVSLSPAAAAHEEGLEYSVAGGYVRALNPTLTFEVRGGVSGGTRKFDPAGEGAPAASLLESGSSLGVFPTAEGESSRTDGVLTPMLRWELSQASVKFGMTGRLSKHSVLQSRPGDYLFSDGPALVVGRGYAGAVSSPKASFSTEELGGFVQVDTELRPGLRASAGARIDYEWLPQDAVLNTDWLDATGLRNDLSPGGRWQPSGHVGVTWDARPETRVFGSVAVHQGDVDPRVLGELFARDVGASETRYAGSGLSWPDGPIPVGPSTLPTLTLLGPDTRAPRSIEGRAGLVQRLIGGWSLYVGGALRRTDFLVRRRNLNLPVIPQNADPNGRGIYGTLQKEGALVTATGTDARRFTQFGSVWALDPDGWSRYWGATAGLEYAADGVGLFAAYTRSETTDNWVGASRAIPDAALSPLLPDASWTEGTSDFDVPHRVTAAGVVQMGLVTLSGTYRFRSGLPFTPRYRDGVDANGDGSLRNDVAFVEAGVVDPLLSDWACLNDQVGGFAVRNSCRGPAAHFLDVRVQVRVGRLGGRDASLVLDGLNLVESEAGVIDDALLLVDPSGSITTSPDGSTVTIPFMVNPDFGHVLYPTSRGRVLRVGFRIG